LEFDRVDCFDKISVRIPKHWQDRYEESGTYEFFDPSGGSGTLRVSLITVNRTENATLDTIKQEQFEKDKEGISFFVIRDEIVAAEWNEPGDLEEDIQLFWWNLATNVDARTTRRALFSYAVPKSRLEDAGFREELGLVKDCVFATHFFAPRSN
jgi:hypothetical protein